MSSAVLRFTGGASGRRVLCGSLASMSTAVPTFARTQPRPSTECLAFLRNPPSAAHRRPLSTFQRATASSSNSAALAALAALTAIAVGVYQVSPLARCIRPARPLRASHPYPLPLSSSPLPQSTTAVSDATPPEPGKSGAPGLSAKDFTPLKLKRVTPYNHNSAVYTFALPDASSYLNLPVSSCVMTRTKGADGKDVVRPYTPIDTHRQGEVVLLVKTYPTGVMSQRFAQLKTGDTLDFKGPMPKLKYEANMKKKIGMIAGGTGITPMLQVLEEVANNKADATQVHLVFANVSFKDVLLKETLDALTKRNRNISVTYFIDSKDSDKDWQGEVGHIDKDAIKRVIPFTPKDGNDVLMYVCGPPAMMKAISGDKAKESVAVAVLPASPSLLAPSDGSADLSAVCCGCARVSGSYSQGEVGGALKELGFTKEQVYKF